MYIKNYNLKSMIRGSDSNDGILIYTGVTSAKNNWESRIKYEPKKSVGKHWGAIKEARSLKKGSTKSKVWHLALLFPSKNLLICRQPLRGWEAKQNFRLIGLGSKKFKFKVPKEKKLWQTSKVSSWGLWKDYSLEKKLTRNRPAHLKPNPIQLYLKVN